MCQRGSLDFLDASGGYCLELGDLWPHLLCHGRNANEPGGKVQLQVALLQAACLSRDLGTAAAFQNAPLDHAIRLRDHSLSRKSAVKSAKV